MNEFKTDKDFLEARAPNYINLYIYDENHNIFEVNSNFTYLGFKAYDIIDIIPKMLESQFYKAPDGIKDRMLII
jgi:hypothetical protein